LPSPPQTPDEIVALFERAITPRTKVLAFSHIASPTGLILPVKQICAMARAKGILTHVDGAHAVGQLPLDLHDLGCDFYASSPHKWLMSPKGTGMLYVRPELLERLWVNTCSGSWHDYTLKAYRFENLGTSNLSVMVGFRVALDFYQTVGAERIYARIHQQAGRVRDVIALHPELQFGNATRDDFYGGLVSFFNTKGDLAKTTDACNKRQIRTGYGSPRMRIATHIFTQQPEINAFADALAAGLRT
jgi:isopenicillin-N epimerase